MAYERHQQPAQPYCCSDEDHNIYANSKRSRFFDLYLNTPKMLDIAMQRLHSAI